LIKSAESLETAHRVNVVVLDKTGTITMGKPEVSSWHWTAADTLYRHLLFAMENRSEHPLAEAVLRKLKQEDTIETLKLEQFESITGQGIQAMYAGQNYWVGHEKMIEAKGILIPDELKVRAQNWREAANTVIYFAGAQTGVLAVMALADPIKSSSPAAVAQLRKQGIEVYMLTGDNPQTTAAVAHLAGIPQYQAELMPIDKAKFIQKLQEEGKTVAMVGDGINDAPALAQADLSIAMAKGTDIAMDVASITLMRSELSALPQVFFLSKRTVGTIRQNLFWAFIYNLIGIPIAAGVLYPALGFLLNPMLAGIAMALSSVSVVTNSLRLKQ
jgi:Cu2+-exporting ATPase